MRAPVRLMGLVVLVLLTVGAFLFFKNGVPTRVSLSDGTELRIRKVSRGTNHVYSFEDMWKQGLRRFLPGASRRFLGVPQVTQLQTRHDSLVIWLDRVSSTNGRVMAMKSGLFEASFADGRTVEGKLPYRAASSVLAVEFAQFERALPQVPLQLRDGPSVFQFLVVNPQPVKAARWESKPLPQIREIMQTKVILTGNSTKSLGSGSQERFQVQVHARTLDDRQTAWMAWRATAIDPLGNWVESQWSYSGRGLIELPILRDTHSPWKLSVEGREYISAGHVFPLTGGNYEIASIDERARALGVRFIMVSGNGTFLVTNGVVTTPNVPLPNAPSILTNWQDGTNWSLALTTPISGITCVFDQGNNPDIQARIRERLDDNDGRIFAALRTVHALPSTQAATTARFFEMRLPQATRNLEAEIIATHRAVEFFIEPVTSRRP